MSTRRHFLGGICGFGFIASTRLNGQTPPLQHCGDLATQGAHEIYYDRNGLIAQRNCDGGDTAQREGWYWLGLAVTTANNLGAPWPQRGLSFEQVMSKLEIGQTGTFRRNPDKWNDPADFTRDQTVPIVAAMGFRNDTLRLQRFYQELRRRNWFAQKHGDEMTTPVYRNLVARARNEAPNPFTDAAFLFAAAEARVLGSRSNKDDVGDDLNLIVILLLATVRRPSAGVDWVRSYYSKNRPDNYGMFLDAYRAAYGTDWTGKTTKEEMARRIDAGIKAKWKPDCPRILGALRWYFRAESGGSPGLAELYAPIIQKWFQ
jgi:hypothetical protein